MADSALSTSPLRPHVAAAAEQQQLRWIGGTTVRVVLGDEHTGGQLAVVESRLTRGDAAPMHVHTREDEVFFMLEGQATVWVGGERLAVEEGGVAFLPRDLQHTYRIDSPTARMLTLTTPGGFAGFFRAAGHDLATAGPDDVVTPDRMAEVFAAHGGRLVGPPPGLDD